ncbi:GyrI-like domain-containing protein [Actinospica durhamensis]|uniref:GyrI-like domain-containing protein n=1 Tax=Actinospica durhamensis TaxID=1508375 RepID=A0A941EQF9_9ACTN|nr:GyrI-like domain-containing protein [Actinospica durhamensis]MBR7831874.1 GyrI-like domain-containing protein [Actinospica durhamensis]
MSEQAAESTVEPTIEDWPEQPYLAVTGIVTLETIGTVARRVPELLAHLAAQGIEPAGAPFLRYRVIDMFRRLEIEAGIPLAAPVPTDGELHCDVLSAGRYVTHTFVGRPEDHIPVIGAIFTWAEERNLAWDVAPGEEGEVWGGRLSIELSGSAVGPEVNALTTKFAFRLAD